MGQYDFTHTLPNDFSDRVILLLEQFYSNQEAAAAFQQCRFEYEDKGLAYYNGFIHGDFWEKHAIDLTIHGEAKYTKILKNNQDTLRNAISKALRQNISGLVIDEIIFLSESLSPFPASNEERYKTDLATANIILKHLLRIGERLCLNATYHKESSENSINDFFRDGFSLIGYDEVKDQSRHGMSTNGKDAGEVDLLISKEGKEVAIFEGLKLNSANTTYIDSHINKAIINYNALGTPTFIVAYVLSDSYDKFWTKYVEHIQHFEFPITIYKSLEAMPSPNAAIRVAQMVLSRDDFIFPVYFIALHIN